MSKRKKKRKGKTTQAPPRPKMNDGDRIIQAAVQNLKTTH